ncbi:efflux RND transporter periplasmic adaptor subunit [Desulfosporosinus sp. FKB]|uniref:efflux RND transporter periplasmic adaptor subunit n=1 Tax=Desulfosporosinus sp. FKB TaxID=1969835 RepID=UPI000B49BDE5|nr:efflux RND transporter periplasmic adaptor subunit [Desulfosporosinus sp. FKB]
MFIRLKQSRIAKITKISKRKVIPVIVIILALIIGFTISKGKKPNSMTVSTPTATKVSVKVYQVKKTEKDITLTYKVSLQASQEGIVSNKVSGKVVQVMFKNGDHVTQGTPLVKLDDQDIKNNIATSQSTLTSSQITLEKNQLTLDDAQRSYDRTKALYDQGAASKTDLESADTKLKNAQYDLESTKATINTAQIELTNLQESLANTTITAPISGVMDEKNVDLGQYANIGSTFGKVKDISPIYAVIAVPQNDLSSVKVGQTVKVMVGEDNSKEYDGVVKRIELSADTTSRVFECKIELSNQDQSLKPGMYGTVTIVGGQKKEMLAVPTDALIGSAGDYSVFVNDKGTAREHIVSIGQIANGLVEIKNGLNDGDSVITTNVNTLQDGDAVAVVSK